MSQYNSSGQALTIDLPRGTVLRLSQTPGLFLQHSCRLGPSLHFALPAAGHRTLRCMIQANPLHPESPADVLTKASEQAIPATRAHGKTATMAYGGWVVRPPACSPTLGPPIIPSLVALSPMLSPHQHLPVAFPIEHHYELPWSSALPCPLCLYIDPCLLILNGRLLHYASEHALLSGKAWHTVRGDSVP